ncbi:hypothetical protein ACHAWF_005260 [Thalassiosira exigua]
MIFAALVVATGGGWRAAAAVAAGPTFVPLLRRGPALAGAVRRHRTTGGVLAASEPSLAVPPRSPSSPARAPRRGRTRARTLPLLRASASHRPPDDATARFSTEAREPEPFSWDTLTGLFRSPAGPGGGGDGGRRIVPSDHPNLALFRRSTAVQKSYEEHKKHLDARWRSPYDYLVVTKFGEEFGFERAVHSDADDFCVYKASPSLDQASEFAIRNGLTYLKLVPNEFPYDVEEGIEHWCLWKIGGTDVSDGILGEEMTWATDQLEGMRWDGSCGSGLIADAQDVAALPSPQARTIKSAAQNAAIEDSLSWVNPPHLQSMPLLPHAHILVLRSCQEESDDVSVPPSPPI